MLSLLADRDLRKLVRALFFATALLAASPAWGQLPTLDELSSRLGGDIAKSGKKTVIVLDFLSPEGAVPAVGPFLADRLSEALARTAKDFRVVDRSRLNAILEEQKVPVGDALNPERIAKLVGALVGAEIVITGSVQTTPDTVALSVSVRDVSTGIIASIDSITTPGVKDTTFRTAKVRYPGGTFMALFTVEQQFPIAHPLHGVLFFDAGNAWDLVQEARPFDLKMGAGAGIRLEIPLLGNIGFDFGYGFNRGDLGDHPKWVGHFLLGQTSF